MERNFTCEDCGAVYSTQGNLTRHQGSAHHSGEARRVKCDICPKLFKDGYQMRQHRKIHSGLKPFECPECPKRFSSEEKLIEHFRSHYNVKEFACPNCLKGFKYKRSFRRHVKSHCRHRSVEVVNSSTSRLSFSSISTSFV